MATVAIARRAPTRRPISTSHRALRRITTRLGVHEKHAESVQTAQNKAVIITAVSPAELKAHAHDLSNDALAKHLINNGLGATLRKLTEFLPYLEELTKRFTHLRKGQTIMGYSTMDAFCRAELHRTSRAVRFALSGGNPNNKKKQQAEPTSFWAALAGSLNELVPSSSDGVEHKVPNRIETAILKIRAGEKIEPKWALDQIVFSCQEISAIFGCYAKMLDSKKAQHFLTNPNIAKAAQRIAEKLARRSI